MATSPHSCYTDVLHCDSDILCFGEIGQQIQWPVCDWRLLHFQHIDGMSASWPGHLCVCAQMVNWLAMVWMSSPTIWLSSRATAQCVR